MDDIHPNTSTKCHTKISPATFWNQSIVAPKSNSFEMSETIKCIIMECAAVKNHGIYLKCVGFVQISFFSAAAIQIEEKCKNNKKKHSHFINHTNYDIQLVRAIDVRCKNSGNSVPTNNTKNNEFQPKINCQNGCVLHRRRQLAADVPIFLFFFLFVWTLLRPRPRPWFIGSLK